MGLRKHRKTDFFATEIANTAKGTGVITLPAAPERPEQNTVIFSAEDKKIKSGGFFGGWISHQFKCAQPHFLPHFLPNNSELNHFFT